MKSALAAVGTVVITVVALWILSRPSTATALVEQRAELASIGAILETAKELHARGAVTDPYLAIVARQNAAAARAAAEELASRGTPDLVARARALAATADGLTH